MYSNLYTPSCIVLQEEDTTLQHYSTLQIELAPQKTDPTEDLPRLIILIH